MRRGEIFIFIFYFLNFNLNLNICLRAKKLVYELWLHWMNKANNWIILKKIWTKSILICEKPKRILPVWKNVAEFVSVHAISMFPNLDIKLNINCIKMIDQKNLKKTPVHGKHRKMVKLLAVSLQGLLMKGMVVVQWLLLI